MERSVADPRGGPPIVVRATIHLEEGVDPSSPSLVPELERLREQLDAAVRVVLPAGTPVPRPDRSVDELIETYRPRQPELLDLLRDEGELSASEHDALRRRLFEGEEARPAPAGVPITQRPIAAAPLESDRAPAIARPIEELLRIYQITSLKQAGAVRARRQISFEEYMALKRHFAAPAPA